MRKPKIDTQSVINCGDRDDAYLAYMAMFRYAFGRMTYMPSVVIGIIKRNKENIPDRALMLINTELAEEADRYERGYTRNITNMKATTAWSATANYGLRSTNG